MLVRRMPITRQPIRTPMDRMIERFWEEALPTNQQNSMALNAIENDDAYMLSAEVPGFEAEDIEINLHDNVLTISAEHSEETVEEGTKILLRERRSGRYERSVRFPMAVDVDGVSAEYVNGILNITVPKAPEAKPRQIPVKVNTEQS
jgi:HSP20 family protein